MKKIVRNLLLSGLCAAAGAPAFGAGIDCKDASKAQAVNASFAADNAARQDALTQHTAERLTRIDGEAKALIKAGVWTQDDRRAYFGKQRATPAYANLESKKTEPLFAIQLGVSTVPGLAAPNPTGACGYASNVFTAYDDLQKITDTEYDILEQGMQEIATSKNVSLAP